jgi:hypothetical protein
MTDQLEQIYVEIIDLHDESDDLQMLEALANNAIFVLSKMQQSEKVLLMPAERTKMDQVLSDLLNTMNKELLWAKQEHQDLLEQHRWFIKAKKQFLEDMKGLFESL